MEFTAEDVMYKDQYMQNKKNASRRIKDGGGVGGYEHNENGIDLTGNSSFSVLNRNINESSSAVGTVEMSKRNFYLQLFRVYAELPFSELLENFIQVYKDVFIKEKPITI
jgi:hypothetical protein